MSSFSIEDKLSPTETVQDVASEHGSPNDEVDSRRVYWKLDMRLVPLSCLLYLLSFLDRTSIGNAKIAGMVDDLHLTGLKYNLCAAILLIPYALLEVPSNLALKKLGPSRWIPFIMAAWGIIVVAEGFVKSFGGLMTARVFQGMAESGIFPGLTFYLCVWYPRTAHAQRISLLYSAVTLAGAFGGLLAFAIVKMDGIGGLNGWSWIFILEGLVTFIVAIFAWFYMSDYPENASFLTKLEREWLVETIKQDSTGLSKEFKRKFVFQALRDPHVWMLFGIHFCLIIPAYAFSLFLPTMITGLGFSSSKAQLLSVPPNAAGCLTTVVGGVLSDRFRARGPFILVGSLTALAGYCILFTTADSWTGYVGTILAACGLFPSIACVLAWAGGNSGGEVKRAVAIAIVIGCGNLGPIVSSFIYRQQDSPRYLPGHGTAIGCLCVAIVLSMVAMLEFTRLNRKKTAKCEHDGITEDMAGDFVEMGDASPLYRYTI
ncbi:MFS general substrate transporter [Dichomitus squalens]|uniref:MFS general substrate transporter n=1 Tax=Dichomitus squalens TaxID=114155 RepID=A0A4Q9M4P6_9APHY|nr:MFS general substrate transporter [Dichomitus squalens]